MKQSHCVAHNKANFKGKEKTCNPHGTTMNGLLINEELMKKEKSSDLNANHLKLLKITHEKCAQSQDKMAIKPK